MLLFAIVENGKMKLKLKHYNPQYVPAAAEESVEKIIVNIAERDIGRKESDL